MSSGAFNMVLRNLLHADIRYVLPPRTVAQQIHESPRDVSNKGKSEAKEAFYS